MGVTLGNSPECAGQRPYSGGYALRLGPVSAEIERERGGERLGLGLSFLPHRRQHLRPLLNPCDSHPQGFVVNSLPTPATPATPLIGRRFVGVGVDLAWGQVRRGPRVTASSSPAKLLRWQTPFGTAWTSSYPTSWISLRSTPGSSRPLTLPLGTRPLTFCAPLSLRTPAGSVRCSLPGGPSMSPSTASCGLTSRTRRRRTLSGMPSRGSWIPCCLARGSLRWSRTRLEL